MSNYTQKVAKVKEAMDNRYEVKQTNKKTDISGSFEGDTVSYPTVQAVKTYVEGKGYLTSHQDISGKEDKSNKVSSWSGTTSDSRYPSEKLVKDSLDNKVDSDSISDVVRTSNVTGLIKNDGSIDTNTYLTSHQSLANYIQKSSTGGLVKNDGTIDTNTYLTEHQSLANYVQKSNTSGLIKNDGTIDTNTYLTSHQSLANYIQKSSTSGLVKNDGTIDTNTYLTEHQSLDETIVTVEKLATAESGYLSSYVVKQNDTQVGDTINIPKDYLVKSATMETCSVANTPVSGYAIGDKYLDFVINTKDSSATDSHIYILVSDLIDTYTADGSTLQLSNGQFSVKNGGIGTTQLSSEVNSILTSWTDSPAHAITNTQISAWESMASGGMTQSQVDESINAALGELALAIDPTINLNSS